MSTCFGAHSSVGVSLSAPTPPESTTKVSRHGTTASLCLSPCLHLKPHRGPDRHALICLAQDLGEDRGGDITAEHSHQTVCLAAPRGNQFNSPQLLASTGRGGGGTGQRCVVCVSGGCYCLSGQEGNLIKWD